MEERNSEVIKKNILTKIRTFLANLFKKNEKKLLNEHVANDMSHFNQSRDDYIDSLKVSVNANTSNKHLVDLEVNEYLTNLPINIYSKIPFDVRQKIAKEAMKYKGDSIEIDVSKELKDLNISDEAKKIILAIYEKYLNNNEKR